MEELRQTKEYAKYIGLLGWQVDYINEIYIYSKKLPLLGYFSKIQRPLLSVSSNTLDKLKQLRHPFVIAIEPVNSDQEQSLLDKFHYKKTKDSSLPSKTIHIDLTQDEKEILAKMHQKTRYNIKMAQKKNIKISQSKDIELFSRVWHECAKKRGLFLSLNKEILSIYEAFGNKARIFLAEDEKDVAGGILLLLTNEGAYYMYAAATRKGKMKFAPTLLAWETILYAKSQGKKYYDFEGIFDERFPINSWKGFSRFKLSFGGEMIEYPGIIRKSYFPFRLK